MKLSLKDFTVPPENRLKVYGRLVLALFFISSTAFYVAMELVTNKKLYLTTKEGIDVCPLNLKYPVTREVAESTAPNCTIFRYSARVGMILFIAGFGNHVYMWFKGYNKWQKAISNTLIVIAMASAAFAGYRLTDGLSLTCTGLSRLDYYCDTASFASYGSYTTYLELEYYYYTYRNLTIVQCINMGVLVLFSMLDGKTLDKLNPLKRKKSNENIAMSIGKSSSVSRFKI